MEDSGKDTELEKKKLEKKKLKKNLNRVKKEKEQLSEKLEEGTTSFPSLEISKNQKAKIEKTLEEGESLEEWGAKAIRNYLVGRQGLSVRRNVREYVSKLHSDISILNQKCDNQAEEISKLREHKAELKRKVKKERSRANTAEAQAQKAMEEVISLQEKNRERELSSVDLNLRLEKLKKEEEFLRNTSEKLREKLEAERPLTDREKWMEELGRDLKRAGDIISGLVSVSSEPQPAEE